MNMYIPHLNLRLIIICRKDIKEKWIIYFTTYLISCLVKQIIR